MKKLLFLSCSVVLALLAVAGTKYSSDFFTTPKLVATNAVVGGLTNTGVAASSLLRVDANQKMAPVTIGSGITFDGTTLTGTGVGGGDVVGPPSSTTLTLSAFLGTSGKVITNTMLEYSSFGGLRAPDLLTAGAGIKLETGTINVHAATITAGAGSPESTISAPVGSIYQQTNASGTSGVWFKTNGTASTGWWLVQGGGGGGTGDVVGPASATDNAIARFDTTTGKLIQDSSIIAHDDGKLLVPGTQTNAGQVRIQGGTSGGTLVISRTNSNIPGVTINSYSNVAPQIIVQRHRDTEAAPSAIQSGDQLGQLEFLGYGASNLRSSFMIRPEAMSAFSSTSAETLTMFRGGNNSSSARDLWGLSPYNWTNYVASRFASNATFEAVVQIAEQSAPATPSSGFGRLYAKADGKLYWLDDGGTEVDLTLGASGGEANVNGEVAVTNATRVGLVYGKSGITNLLRSIEGGFGIGLTNRGTNIDIAITDAELIEWAGISTNKIVMTNDSWLITRGSNGVVVAAGTAVGVASSGSAGQQTFTVSVNDAELLEWAGVSTNKVAFTNSIVVTNGTGGITVTRAIGSDGVVRYAVSDDDAGTSASTNFAGIILTNQLERTTAFLGNSSNIVVDLAGAGLQIAWPTNVFTWTFANAPSANSLSRETQVIIICTNGNITAGYFPTNDYMFQPPVMLSVPSTNVYWVQCNTNGVHIMSGQELTTGTGPTVLQTNAMMSPAATADRVAVLAASTGRLTNDSITITQLRFLGNIGDGADLTNFAGTVSAAGLGTLTNAAGTGLLTNIWSASFSNATSKPLVFPVSNGLHTNQTGKIAGLEGGTAGVTISLNPSNAAVNLHDILTNIVGSGTVTNWTGTNANLTGITQITNVPGANPGLRIRNTNGTGYVELGLDNVSTLHSNRFIFAITNPIAGQVLGLGSVSTASGITTTVITNAVDSVGAGGDAFSVNGVAATDANLEDSIDMTWALDTGTSPDDIAGNFNRTANLAGNVGLAASHAVFSDTGLIFEGATADTLEGLLTSSDITGSDKTWTLPNASGTVAVSATSGSGITLGALGDIGTSAVLSNAVATGVQTNVFDTIYVDAAAMVSNITAGATFSTEESQGTMTTTNKMVDSYVFSGSTSNFVQFKLSMPLDWDNGTVRVKLWTWTTNNVTTATNVWCVQALSLTNANVVTNLTWGTAAMCSNNVSSAGGAISLTPATETLTVGNSPSGSHGQLVLWRIWRNTGHGLDRDSAGADGGQSKILGAWIQYKRSLAAVAQW